MLDNGLAASHSLNQVCEMPKFVAAVVIAIFILGGTALGQVSDSLRQRCDTIIIEAIRKGKQQPPNVRTISLARLVPLERVEDVLIRSLSAKDIQARFTAAEILLQDTPMLYENSIIDSLKQLEINHPPELVRRAAILMKLGDKAAKKEIQHWANHEFESFEMGGWVCPMMCVEPSNHAGRCEKCAMEKVKRTRAPDGNDWQARVDALRVLQIEDENVADRARSIVASNAPASVRLTAIELWAKENSQESLPHLKIFLDSPLQFNALFIAGDHMPKACVANFKKVITTENTDWLLKSEAYRGLLKAGETSRLPEIRTWIDLPATNEAKKLKKIIGIVLLGEFGTDEDIARIAKLLDTDFKVLAAKVLIQRASR